jgi:hypothetical protein
MNTIVPLVNRKARLAAITTAETTPKLHLGQQNRTLDEYTTLADVLPEEADFDGYLPAGKAVTWTPGYIDPTGTPANESQLFEYMMPANPATPNQIYYWWIDDGTKILLCGNFDGPVGMANEGNKLAFVVEDSYPPGMASHQVVP